MLLGTHVCMPPNATDRQTHACTHTHTQRPWPLPPPPARRRAPPSLPPPSTGPFLAPSPAPLARTRARWGRTAPWRCPPRKTWPCCPCTWPARPCPATGSGTAAVRRTWAMPLPRWVPMRVLYMETLLSCISGRSSHMHHAVASPSDPTHPTCTRAQVRTVGAGPGKREKRRRCPTTVRPLLATWWCPSPSRPSPPSPAAAPPLCPRRTAPRTCAPCTCTSQAHTCTCVHGWRHVSIL